MSSTQKMYELVHLADRAKANGNYTLAQKFIEQLFVEALKTKDARLITIAAEALFEHRRLHIANVLRDIKRIDPLQSLRKALS